MSDKRIIVLMHEDLVPPDPVERPETIATADWKTEYDVVTQLRKLGHEVRPLGVARDLTPIRDAIVDWKPHLAFNLLEEFHGVAVYDQHMAAYLELMRQPYTGCNPRGLMLAHDKVLCKKILTYHRIEVPEFALFPRGRKVRRPKNLKFPLLVKSATEDASLGIAQASVVGNDAKLHERVEYLHEQLSTDALVEEFVEGRELYVGVLGNSRLRTFPVWEMSFAGMPEGTAHIATAKVKWDHKYQEKYGISTGAAKHLPNGAAEHLDRLSKRIYKTLNLSGYARMDFRLTPEGKPYVLEANPNPNLALGEDFAESAAHDGLKYGELLQQILNLGLQYRAEWKLA
jgi:D-alanine-D-alanine ligase